MQKQKREDGNLSEKEELRRLKAENRRLHRENEYLRHRAALRRMPREPLSEETKHFSEAVRLSHALHARTYFGYLLERFRRSRLFLIYDKTRFAVRGFFFATKLWHLLIFVFSLLGISAQFLFIAGALMVFLPAAVLSSLTVGIYGYFIHRKRNRLLQKQLHEKKIIRIYLIFAQTERMHHFSRYLDEMTKKGAVFLISRSFRECGFSGASQIGVNLYRIHISFYFSFIRHLDAFRIIKIHL